MAPPYPSYVASYFPKSRVQTENGTCTYDVKGFYSIHIRLHCYMSVLASLFYESFFKIILLHADQI